MSLSMKLRTRLHLVVTGLTIVWVIVLLATEVQVTRARAQEEIDAANQVATQLLGRLVNIYWRAGGTRIVADFLTQLGHVRSNDIVLTYPGGPVLYHSPPATYKAGRYAPAWFAHLLVPRIPRYTYPLPSGVELVVQAEPSRGILDGWDAITRLLAIAAVMLIIVNGLAFWIVERAVAPVMIEQRLDEERRLIAHELHDEFGQSVTAIRSLAQAIVGQSSQPSLQEALINALRHANASHVDIELRSERRSLTVTITDDGVGLPEDWSRPGHYGLQGLSERVGHLGGKLTLRNCERRGTLLAAEIPIRASRG